jgi:class 3 adenylate cyclase
VVLFADLSGFTALSERLDPEEVSLVMHGLLGELADVVYRYEGYVDKYIGDAIMALFGAPIAHENDAERAVLAALDMLKVTARRSDDSDHLLSIRVGLNQGEVVAAHVGSESRQQYTVMGDTVNVASRLEGAAAPDSVLVSQSVYERIGSRFETEAVDPVTVKGKAEPLQAYRVVRYRPSTPAPTQATTPFVGRDEELALVVRHRGRGWRWKEPTRERGALAGRPAARPSRGRVFADRSPGEPIRLGRSLSPVDRRSGRRGARR